MTVGRDPLEAVIRPIVEGQIRGFVKEHPSILGGVNWYRRRDDKATTLVNSLAKRITLDLLSTHTRTRIEAALFEAWENERGSDVECLTASECGDAGTPTGVERTSKRGIDPAQGVDGLEPSTGPSIALLPSIEWGAATTATGVSP
jgi:hypothetical protein